MSNKRNILLPNGKIITRTVKAEAFGNFCELSVRINNNIFSIGTGSEYLHGEPEIYELNCIMNGRKPGIKINDPIVIPPKKIPLHLLHIQN